MQQLLSELALHKCAPNALPPAAREASVTHANDHPDTRSPQGCLESARTLSIVLMRLTEPCWSGSSFASRCGACARRCLDGRVFRTRVAGSSAACTRNQAFPCIAQRSSAHLEENRRAQHSRHAALPPALWVRATPLGTCASVICRTVRAQSPSWRAAHSSPQTLIIAGSQRTSLKCSWGVYHRPPPQLHLQSSQRKDARRINV